MICYDIHNMRYIYFFSIFFFFSAINAQAYNPSLNTTEIPYEIFTADSKVGLKAEYLGELSGYPQMYEFTLGQDEELYLSLSQADNEEIVPFSVIVVRENDKNGGVAEIGRLRSDEANWVRTKDSVLGISLLQTDSFTAPIGSGVYRVEVSTPDNEGKYMLTIGQDDPEVGYFKTVGGVRQIQSFFDYSIFSLLKSSFVFYPVGIIVLLGLFFFTRRYKDELRARFSNQK